MDCRFPLHMELVLKLLHLYSTQEVLAFDFQQLILPHNSSLLYKNLWGMVYLIQSSIFLVDKLHNLIEFCLSYSGCKYQVGIL